MGLAVTAPGGLGFWLGALLLVGCTVSPVEPAAPPPAGLLLLGGGRVLAWSPDGGLQAGMVGGRLGEAPRLPLTYVRDAQAWNGGALVAGSVSAAGQEDQARVVEVGPAGSEHRIWSLGAGVASAVAGGPDQPIAAAFGGLFALEPGGGVRAVAATPPLTIARGLGERPILCHPANLTLADQAPAACTWEDPSGHPHRAEGTWTSAPIPCGPWLLEPGSARVEVRALRDGSQAGSFPIAPGAPVACLDTDTALAGGERVHVIALPGGARIATRPCGSGPPTLLAAAEGAAACVSQDGGVHAVMAEGGGAAGPGSP